MDDQAVQIILRALPAHIAGWVVQSAVEDAEERGEPLDVTATLAEMLQFVMDVDLDRGEEADTPATPAASPVFH